MACNDAGDDVSEVGVRVDAVELRGLYERGDGRPVFATTVGTGEERILSLEGQHPFIVPMSGTNWKFFIAGIHILVEWFSLRRVEQGVAWLVSQGKAKTPRFTASILSGKWRWQLLKPLAEWAMLIIGLSMNSPNSSYMAASCFLKDLIGVENFSTSPTCESECKIDTLSRGIGVQF